jgi:catechol 2,3-dioxygenase-like lactoylglutathione lyase family enzyme
MKRLHVNVSVADLDQSVRFYSTLFGSEPSVKHDDYAKWMLDDPRVNFAISTRGVPGLDHLGIQAETGEELGEIAQRLKAADESVLEQKDASCCYAKSDKAWVRDPSGLNWETFHTSGQITTYGGDTASKLRQQAAQVQVGGPTPASASCCAPEMAKAQQPASTCGAKSCG